MKSIVNEAPEKKILLLSVHIAKMEAQEEMEISEKLHLKNVRRQIEHDQQDSENHNKKLFNRSKTFDRNICELKVYYHCQLKIVHHFFVFVYVSGFYL